jgi:hypothetical protein
MVSGVGENSCRPAVAARQLPITRMAHKTAIIGDDFVGAVLAARDMPAEGCRAAALDRRHHLQLAKYDMAGVGFAPRRSVVTEDIRDLQNETPHDRRSLRRRLGVSGLEGQTIQRAHDVADGVCSSSPMSKSSRSICRSRPTRIP